MAPEKIQGCFRSIECILFLRISIIMVISVDNNGSKCNKSLQHRFTFLGFI
jgi:hypothetical protein